MRDLVARQGRCARLPFRSGVARTTEVWNVSLFVTFVWAHSECDFFERRADLFPHIVRRQLQLYAVLDDELFQNLDQRTPCHVQNRRHLREESA